jgi:hypothetical protein
VSNGAGGNVCQCGVSTRPGAQVRPVALDAAERWDRAIVHTLSGTYGPYRVFCKCLARSSKIQHHEARLLKLPADPKDLEF